VSSEHIFHATLRWNPKAPAVGGYSHAYTVEIPGRPILAGSADAAFGGDPTRHNPEDMLLAALASCHMLSFLWAANAAGVVVRDYRDAATATLADVGKRLRFTEAVLRPAVVLAPGSDLALVPKLHERAHRVCFIANAVNFPVRIEGSATEATA